MFADIFNVLVFGGRQVVTPDALEDITGFSQYKADDANLHEQERDIYKLWKSQRVNLVIMGIENQTKQERDMPFRGIGYDGASYRSQMLKTKSVKVKGKKKTLKVKERYPVITIVLYFGEKPWQYPLKLKESFRPKLPKNEITKALENYITDYKVNLFDIPRLPPETVALFQSDFKVVADYFVNAYNNPEYEPDPAVITHVDELLKLMRVLTGDNRYETISFTEQEKKEGVRMCKVLDARERRGEIRGEKRGLKRGATQMYELMRILIEKGYQIDEVLKMTSGEEAREKLYREYGIV
ncbi:MAG: Rpn family recombination-promoting nuclease/putative transposase [Lachnospiraceae bacterium]